MVGNATVGTVTHEGVTSSSNTATAEEIRASLGIAETPAETEVPDHAPTEEATETTEEVVQPAAPPQEAVSQPTPKAKADPTKDPAKRIAKATYEREQAKREAAAEIQRIREESRLELQRLREEFAAQLKPKDTPAETPKAEAEPTLEQFADQPDPYAAWLRAMARYDLKQEMTAREQQAQQVRQQAEQQAAGRQAILAEQARLAEFGQKLSNAIAQNPDLEVKMQTANVQITRPMSDAIIESDAPERVIDYLIDHPDEADAISAMASPLKQFRAIARLDATLDSPAPAGRSGLPTPKKTTAQPPISPVGGGHAAPAGGPPGDDASYEEHEAYWNRVEREQRMAGARR